MDDNSEGTLVPLGELAIRAAETEIENIIHYSSIGDIDIPNDLLEYLQYETRFNQSELDPNHKLKKINMHLRNSPMWNGIEEIKNLKQFLILIDEKDLPISITNDGNSICRCCDGGSDTTYYYQLESNGYPLEIIETVSESRFEENWTSGCSFSFISQDFIFKSNPESLLTLSKYAIRQAVNNQNRLINKLPFPTVLKEYLKDV